jgi:hypothetical protein
LRDVISKKTTSLRPALQWRLHGSSWIYSDKAED